MFQWAQSTFDKLSEAVAPPPTDGAGRFAYSVQRGEEDAAMGCIAEIDPVYTVLNQAKGQYPIHLACQYSLQRLIQLIMTQPGINVAQPDVAGNTPLHYASMSTAPNGLDVVKLLVTSYGASVLTKNSQGQTPYDLATLNSIRQYLLPIQLQAETQIALDNGGQGLPPGIDMGGLRIKNSAMPPPPTFGGGPPTPGAQPGAQTPGTPAMAGAPAMGGGPVSIPASHMFGTPSPSHPTSQQSNRIVSAPASAAAPATSGSGYSRVGSSSAALSTASKYRADGFHSSSSDVSLQKKYGHSSVSGYGSVAPPPSSGNSAAAATIPQIPSGGANPFAAGGPGSRYGGIPGRRYVSYGQVAQAPAPASGPVYSNYGAPQGGAATGVAMFSPGGSVAAAPAPFAPSPSPAMNTASPQVTAAPRSAGTPTTPYMPPPPYQGHNYDETAAASHVSAPAAAASSYAAMPVASANAVVAQNSANMAEANAGDIFAAPSPQKQAPATEAATEGAVNAGAATPAVVDANPATATSVQPAATQPTAAAPAAELAPNWVETYDPSSGQPYYYNSVTQETSWEKPLATASSAAPVANGTDTSTALPDGWTEHVDPSSGHPYYYNTNTQETSWERPTQAPIQASAAQTIPEETVNQGEESQEVISAYEKAPQAAAAEAPTEQSASEAFGGSAPSKSASNVEVTGETATDAFATPAPANTGASASDTFAAPASTGASASDAFAAPAPAVSAVQATQTFVSPANMTAQSTTQSPFDKGPQRTMSADDLFAADAPDGSTAPTEATPAEPAPEASSEPANNSGEPDGDGLMDDIPLSPSPKSIVAAAAADAAAPGFPPGPAQSAGPQAQEPAAAGTSDADSLFASIGMPPPPFSAKK